MVFYIIGVEIYLLSARETRLGLEIILIVTGT